MKKIIATLMMMALLAVMLPFSVNAQTRYRPTYVYNRPSFYQRHRNKINVAAGTGAGLILGGLIGGRRGAGIGALLGAGGSALYTYKIRNHRSY